MEQPSSPASLPHSRVDAVEEAISATRTLATSLDLLDHVAAQRLGVGRSDLRILDALSRHDGSLSAGTLAEQVGLSRPALSAALNRLEQRGLVHRQMHHADRRSVVVSATPAAQGQLAGLFSNVHEHVRNVLSELKPADLQLVTAVVSRLAASIQTVADTST